MWFDLIRLFIIHKTSKKTCLQEEEKNNNLKKLIKIELIKIRPKNYINNKKKKNECSVAMILKQKLTKEKTEI